MTSSDDLHTNLPALIFEDLIVQKYGGSSVADTLKIEKIAQYICRQKEIFPKRKFIVVISAMGDQTDDLLAQAYSLSPNPPRRELDMLLSAGERISMALLGIALQKYGVGAISLTGSQCGILTDHNHGNASIVAIKGERIQQALAKDLVVIVAGFQGVNPETREITTLGRGGSDLTALALAARFHARHCELMKDVSGVMSGDPRMVRGTRNIKHMSWDEMSELSWKGSQVIHHRALQIAKSFHIPIIIKKTDEPENCQTLIEGDIHMEQAHIRSMTYKKDQVYCIIKKNKAQLAASDLASLLWEQGETPLMFQETLLDMRFFAPASLRNLIEDWSEKLLTSSEIDQPVWLISLVGHGFRQDPSMMGRLQNRLQSLEVRYFQLENMCVTIGVQADDAEKALDLLHGFT